MLINFDNLSTNQTYFCMTQTILPRPIAWILTQNDKHNYNLAPFSYFNAVCSDPPLLMVSIGYKTDGNPKDTVTNLQRTKKAIVHIASSNQIAALNQTAAELDYGQSEIDLSEIALETIEGFSLPIVAHCPIAYECDLYEATQIGAKKQHILYLQAKQIYINDQYAIMDENQRLHVDSKGVDPLARLGGNEYATLGDVISRKRGV